MRKFTTLIHLKDNSEPIVDTLNSLKISDEILVIDHVAKEETTKLLRTHGARVVEAINGVHDGAYVTNANNDWVLCLRPTESINEELCAALQRWKQAEEKNDNQIAGYTVTVASPNTNGNQQELRFVNRTRLNWTEELPGSASNVLPLPGSLLLAA